MARRHYHSDPLDLLLDTMTNAFSAIIMIAISVSLFVNETKKQDEGPTPQEQHTIHVVEGIKAEIIDAEKLNAILKGALQQTGTVAQLILTRDAVQAQVTDTVARVVAAETQLPSSNSPSRNVDSLLPILRVLKDKEGKLVAISQGIGDKVAHQQTQQTTELAPPPAVRDTTKSPFTLIFRHNRLYPLMEPGPGGVARNEATLKWTDLGSAAEVEPIPGAGIDAEKNEVAVRDFIASLRKINSSLEGGAALYVASYVYKDSFPAYMKFKQLFNKTGIDQGWEPVPNEDNLKFGATGFKPGVQ